MPADDEVAMAQYEVNLALVKNELGKETRRVPGIKFDSLDEITPESFSDDVYNAADAYITQLNDFYQEQFMKANTMRERRINYYLENQPDVYNALKNSCYNEAVYDVVTKTFDKNKILRDGDGSFKLRTLSIRFQSQRVFSVSEANSSLPISISLAHILRLSGSM